MEGRWPRGIGGVMAGGGESADEVALGLRLRKAREERRLSLKAVEVASGGVVGATMLGAYERGEHSISAWRLCRLARLYDIPLGELVKPLEGETVPLEPAVREEEPVRIELQRLAEAKGPEAKALSRLVRMVEERRRRRSTQWIELRSEDLITAAATLGRSLDAFIEALRRADVLRRPPGRPPGT